MTFHDHRTPLPAAVPPAARGLPGPTKRARKAKPAEPHAATHDPATFPEWYAMWGEGDCCAPEIPSDRHLMCNSRRWPVHGDFVAIHFTPEAAARVGYDAWIKRLVFMQRPPTPGRKPRIASNIAPCLIVESLNPRKQYTIPWSAVRAVHYCAGVLPDDVKLIAAPGAAERRAARQAVRAASKVAA